MTRYTQYNKQEATIAKLEDENRKLKTELEETKALLSTCVDGLIYWIDETRDAREKLTEMRAMVDSAHDQLGKYHKMCNDYSELVDTGRWRLK